MLKSKQTRRASSGKLKRSPAGVNARGAHYVEIIDGILYVDHSQAREFNAALLELCKRFDYKFVPYDEFGETAICASCGANRG